MALYRTDLREEVMYKLALLSKPRTIHVCLQIALASGVVALITPVFADLPPDARIISQSSGYKHSGGLRSGKVVTIGRSAKTSNNRPTGQKRGLNDISDSTLNYLASQKRQEIQRIRAAQAERQLMQMQMEAMRHSSTSRSYIRPADPVFHSNPQQSVPRGLIDTNSGTYMPRAGNGYVDPRNGTFMHDVGGGVINTRTGEFIPKH